MKHVWYKRKLVGSAGSLNTVKIGEMEAIPLFLASASKAILLGAVVPTEMTSQDGAPNVLDSTGGDAAAAGVAVAPAEAAPMAQPEPQVAHVELPPVPPSEPVQPVQPVHPVQAVPSAETTTTTTVTTPGATESATSGAAGAAGAATDATDATAAGAAAADAAGAGAEGGAAGADASAGNSPDAASAVQAVHGESESAAPALKADAQQIVEAVNAKVKDLSKASFASQTEPTHPSHAPVMDETTSMMYVTQKIHDYFSGGISPSDVSSVVKESVTVLREFDKLNE